jgi:hypothetical protein
MLEETNPLYLSTELNYSVLMSEIFLKDDEAFIRGSEAFTKAVAQLPPIKEHEDEAMMVLQCLKDNLEVWKKVTEKNR